MCVRNLCEGNTDNQEVMTNFSFYAMLHFNVALMLSLLLQFVSSMQLKGVLKDELLEKQGISVEVDPACGKFSFSQVPPSKTE